MHKIEIGAKKIDRIVVSAEMAIDFLKLADARVLSTPQMILYMEQSSRNNAVRFLEDGFDTVGTKVNVSHLRSAPLGSEVSFTSEITSATDKRIEFAVTAATDTEVIGEGTHERAIIDKAKFAARNAAKMKSI
jgi:fluoroacetyl-CoA thioesterase